MSEVKAAEVIVTKGVDVTAEATPATVEDSPEILARWNRVCDTLQLYVQSELNLGTR